MTTGPVQGHLIFSPGDIIDSQRDSGYKNAAYAVGELIDNSIQAGARNVELMCRERMNLVSQRARYSLTQIAVLDDGSGMDSETLRLSLRFGQGTHKNDRDGMGRFGMGLPSASISQCTRVNVYSWDGSGRTLFTYLDVDEIRSGSMYEIPEPVEKALPTIWRDSAEHIGETGTLVIWDNLDRCAWSSADGLIKNSEELIGRMYRKFIMSGDANILMSKFKDSETNGVKTLARPNDPLYLSPNSSTPDPWSKEPMFEKWSDNWEKTIRVTYKGSEHEIKLRHSVPKAQAREERNAGTLPHGKHARRNTGVSIVRANREITLDTGLLNVSDERTRWLGLEVEFPPALDEIFGLSNNKQSSVIFSELAQTDINDLALREGYRTHTQFLHALESDGDLRFPILKLHGLIQSSITGMMSEVKNQGRGRGQGGRRHPDPGSAEDIGTKVTKTRQEDGNVGQSDADEKLPLSERQQILIEHLVKRGHTKENATKIAMFHLNENGPSKYLFDSDELDGAAFFQVNHTAGVVNVILNSRHPAFEHLAETLDDSWANEPHPIYESLDDHIAGLTARLANASVGLKLLLAAWARYEDEQQGDQQRIAQDIRFDWGLISRDFLRGMG